LIIQFSGNLFSLVMLVSPLFLMMALASIAGVKGGEARSEG